MLVEEGLQFFLSLDLAHSSPIAYLVEVRCDFSQPSRVHSADLTHVLFAGLNQLVVDDPLGTLVEQSTRGVNKDLLVVSKCLVAAIWVFLRCVVEETSTDGFADLVVVFGVQTAARDHRQTEPVQNLYELVPDVLRPFQSSCLDEVVVAPLHITPVLEPNFVDSKHRQVVSVLVAEASAFLVCYLLFLPRAIEYVLHREHRNDRDDLV